MVKHGIQNCVLSAERLSSNEIMDDILLGKRAVILTLPTFKSLLSIRVKNKGRCGFYISESAVNYHPSFMLFNKKFNKNLKEKIDFK
jgi:hypothetical protein